MIGSRKMTLAKKIKTMKKYKKTIIKKAKCDVKNMRQKKAEKTQKMPQTKLIAMKKINATEEMRKDIVKEQQINLFQNKEK